MTHLAGHCSCGRRIHLSKNAKLGNVWQCHKCFRKWQVATHGRRLHEANSKAPPRRRNTASGSTRTDSGDYELLGTVIGVLIFGAVLYWVLGGWGLILGVCALGYWFYATCLK